MTDAVICTIGDEILIGEILDTNSSKIALALEEAGVAVNSMLSVGDVSKDIEETLSRELEKSSIVITTGGLGPTKDDITKASLARISGSKGYVHSDSQAAIIKDILHARGLDVLPSNMDQAMVPDTAEVIPNRLGTAPIMVFRNVKGGGTLYSLPGVPHEAEAAIPLVIADIRAHNSLPRIIHRSCMVYGMAESALAEMLSPWESALPEGIRLAYLPSTLTGIRLRLSDYEGREELIESEYHKLSGLLGDLKYADGISTLQESVGRILKEKGLTMAAAESCTGGEIAHLATSVSGASAWFLGSVTSYAVSVKEKVLGVPSSVIEEKGVVSSEVAEKMAEGAARVCGADVAVSTTGLAGPSGDGKNPVGTVWIGVSGKKGSRSVKYCYKNDRSRNIERFAASALNFLRLYLKEN